MTWNGKPLAVGAINFLPDCASLKIDPGRVVDGVFEFRATAGAKRVEIWADREVAGQEHVKVMGLRAREQYMPAKFNGRTELTCTVAPDGPNTFRFDLTEK